MERENDNSVNLSSNKELLDLMVKDGHLTNFGFIFICSLHKVIVSYIIDALFSGSLDNKEVEKRSENAKK